MYWVLFDEVQCKPPIKKSKTSSLFDEFTAVETDHEPKSEMDMYAKMKFEPKGTRRAFPKPVLYLKYFGFYNCRFRTRTNSILDS